MDRVSTSPALVFLLSALGCTGAPAGMVDLQPTGRIVSLKGPDSPDLGRSAGCISYGRNAGAGVGNLLLLTGGVDRPVQPGAEGKIQLVVLVHAAGLDPRAASGASPFDLYLLPGEATPEGAFEVVTEPVLGGDGSTWGGRLEGARLSEDGWIESDPTPLVIPVPIFNDFVGSLSLAAVQLRGELEGTTTGLRIRDALLTGYATKDAFLGLLERLATVCKKKSRPQLCEAIPADIAETGDTSGGLALLLQIMSGYDARVEDGHAYSCTPEASPTDCNAVSLCLQVEIEGVLARGPALR